ncbi:LAMI_0G15302g1_1 [Lachancea mirantina]|uniref:LAMI_0G15302g1_1 n=1 Tax=Lachancea mirantina TaxID=1230905 RepID=A0A1G4KCH5_9SACH|nr:LAMI_0G15302g1_1 [Lachancea mirantina]
MLTESQVQQFHDRGYLLIPGFLSSGKATELLERSKKLISQFDPEAHPLTQFTTSDQDHVGGNYFLDSADKISFFFEPEAVQNVDGKMEVVVPKEEAINKFGHGLHLQDPLFEEVTVKNRNVKTIASDLGFKRPRALQSMVICKQPRIGGAVPSHQDSVFLYTDPLSAVGFWIALGDATLDNGCLSFSPGSHLTHSVPKRFIRLKDQQGRDTGETGFEYFEGGKEMEEKWPKDETLPWDVVECKAGDLVLIHGSVLHKSEANKSGKSRFAYAFHLIEGKANYDKRNWLQTEVFSEV